MPLLILILIVFGFYMFLRNQDWGTQVHRLEKRLLELEDQLRRLHVKIVNQLPGFLEEGQAETPKPIFPPPVRRPILGMIGDFRTPPLRSTGVDHPIALFAGILLLRFRSGI